MYSIFLDDSRQNNPSRDGMGPLIAVGGIIVPDQAVYNIEKKIETLCSEYGFTPQEEFKWSPGRELWMRDNLIDEKRKQFFLELLCLLKRIGTKGIVVIEDKECDTATNVNDPELDVTHLFLERIHHFLSRKDSKGKIIADRPGGGNKDNKKFIADRLEFLERGTRYVPNLERITSIETECSKSSRLLQVADIITSCTRAIVGGERDFSPPIFTEIKKILEKDGDRIGGIGLKIHPDLKYANLYHWLLEDDCIWKRNTGHPLPKKSLPYSSDPFIHKRIGA